MLRKLSYLGAFLCICVGEFQISSPPPLRNVNCQQTSCSDLSFACLECSVPGNNCSYGESLDLSCVPKPGSSCAGTEVRKPGNCLYCYQLEAEFYECEPQKKNCSTTSVRDRDIPTVCYAKDNVFCLGRRSFYKKQPCNWTSGYRWSTAFILSLTLGGFGADRFYLGLWQSGLGKLFSFGGLGVWTLIDVILVGTGFVRPSDGSVYIF